MAFGGLMLVNFLLMILLGMALVGVICLITAIILTVLHFRDKRLGKPPRKWKEVVAVILTIVGIVCILPMGTILWFGAQPDYATIQTDQGAVEILEDTAHTFVDTIQANDPEAMAAMLEEHPELLNYKTFEGYNPLGASIRYNAPAVTRYLLELGVDINETGGRGTSIALACRMGVTLNDRLNAEIVSILLDYHPDVNTTDNAMPPIQYIIRYITEDSAITDDDLALLEKFLAEGPDLTAINGAGNDAAAYFESCLEEYPISTEYADQIEAMRAMMRQTP